MNTSKLKAIFGPQARVQDIVRDSSGVSAAYRLRQRREGFFPTVDVARLLVVHGLTPTRAHSIASQLMTAHEIWLIVPSVADRPEFERRLGELGVAAVLHQAPDVDVARIRENLGLTQEEFAARFALAIASVRNWEQGRVKPDEATRTLLAVIEKHPEIAEAAVAA